MDGGHLGQGGGHPESGRPWGWGGGAPAVHCLAWPPLPLSCTGRRRRHSELGSSPAATSEQPPTSPAGLSSFVAQSPSAETHPAVRVRGRSRAWGAPGHAPSAGRTGLAGNPRPAAVAVPCRSSGHRGCRGRGPGLAVPVAWRSVLLRIRAAFPSVGAGWPVGVSPRMAERSSHDGDSREGRAQPPRSARGPGHMAGALSLRSASRASLPPGNGDRVWGGTRPAARGLALTFPLPSCLGRRAKAGPAWGPQSTRQACRPARAPWRPVRTHLWLSVSAKNLGWLGRRDSRMQGRGDSGTQGAGDMGTRGCGGLGMRSASSPFWGFLHRLAESATATLRGTGACSCRGMTGPAVASPPESLLCLDEPVVVWFLGWALPFF